MSVETNWYVITGGSSSGKTKVIDYLSFLGYKTIPENARILIDNEKSKGKTIREIRKNELEFQEKVLQMKIEIEKRLPKEKIIFFDRGIPDSIAYYHFYKADTGHIVKASLQRRYRKIFLMEQLPFEKDDSRTENEEFVRNIQELIHKAYANLKYEVIKVSIKPIEERAKFILEKIKIREGN